MLTLNLGEDLLVPLSHRINIVVLLSNCLSTDLGKSILLGLGLCLTSHLLTVLLLLASLLFLVPFLLTFGSFSLGGLLPSSSSFSL